MTELEMLKIRLSEGLSLPAADQPEFIITNIDRNILAELTVPEQTFEVKEALSLLIKLTIPNLAKIGSNKRLRLIELLQLFDLEKSQFEEIIINFPEFKILDAELLLCAHSQYGLEFATFILDLIIKRKIIFKGIYKVVVDLPMPERRFLLLRAHEGGIQVWPADYIRPLIQTELSSNFLMVDDRTTMHKELTELFEKGATISEISGIIKSRIFKPHILENTLLEILIQISEEHPSTYLEVREIADSLAEVEQLHGRSKWLYSILKMFENVNIPNNGWDEIIQGLHRNRANDQAGNWFDVLLAISPSDYLRLFDYDGSCSSWPDSLFKILFDQLELVAVSNRSANDTVSIPRSHDDLVHQVWSNYSRFISRVEREYDFGVMMSYIRNLAVLGDVEEIDKVGQIRVSHIADQDLLICNSDSFKAERILGLLIQRKTDQAFDAITKLSVSNKQYRYLLFSLCRLAREQYRPDIASQILNLHLAEKRTFDVRTLTIILRSIRINDLPFLNSIYDRLLEIDQKFDANDNRCLHALCEKIRLAGDSAGLATLIDKISKSRGSVHTQIYAQLLFSYLDADEPIKSLSVLKKMAEIDGLENIIEEFGPRIASFDQSIVTDALTSWNSNTETAKRKSPIKRTSSQITEIERDKELPKIIKEIYEATCQLCKVPLRTPTGNISEGAHIHPLGNGHDGPDTIENLLCLCPNHHALLDRHGWYLTDDLSAIETVSGTHLGSISKADSHDISIACIRYQRRFALNRLKSSLEGK